MSTTNRPGIIKLPGLYNVRDLGGMPAGGERKIAPDRLYRAELLMPSALEKDSQKEHEYFAPFRKLGIRTIVDLRSSREVSHSPSAWQAATGAERTIAIPIDDGNEGSDRDYVGMLLGGQLKKFDADDMADHYIQVLEARAKTFVEALTAVAHGAPALVHCTEGKDRTGLLIALILGALGAPPAEIVKDYQLSDILRPDRALSYSARFSAAGVAFENYRVLYEAPEQAMQRALQYLEDAYGGTGAYLRLQGGLNAATLAQLQSTLLI